MDDILTYQIAFFAAGDEVEIHEHEDVTIEFKDYGGVILSRLEQDSDSTKGGKKVFVAFYPNVLYITQVQVEDESE